MKKLTLLGATGSIGKETLDIVRKNPEKLDVRFLSTHTNIDLFLSQIQEFQPEAVVVTHPDFFAEAQQKITSCTLLLGKEQLTQIAGEPVDLCINALVGASGVSPTLQAIDKGIDVALANKETLVTAGVIVTKRAKEKDVSIFPIDSEHSAIWQCLIGEDSSTVRNLILTASGGPFRGKKQGELENATIAQTLKHPNWNMGNKITVDSATLMNKGFEVIEAFWLYKLPLEKIKVVVHPQSVIHSMVEFIDGSFKAQLGVPDMRIPIQYAISYPERWNLKVEELNITKIASLTFEKPDIKKFRCLKLAFNALNENGSMPAVLNAANEVTNFAFLNKKITFTQIASINEEVMNSHQTIQNPSLEEIISSDQWARNYAKQLIQK